MSQEEYERQLLLALARFEFEVNENLNDLKMAFDRFGWNAKCVESYTQSVQEKEQLVEFARKMTSELIAETISSEIPN